MKLIAVMLAFICAVSLTAVTGEADQKIPEKTKVSASLDVKHKIGENVIWCNTFQLAWNSLGKEFCGEPLKLDGALEFEKSMNAASASAKDVDAESVFIRTGKVSNDFMDELNAALKKQFGDDGPKPVANPGPGVLAYAYLFKNLKFATAFEKQAEPFTWYGKDGNGEVQAFGIMKVNGQTPPELKQQILILDESNGYIIELKTKSEQDRLILARVDRKGTLKETLDAVRARVAKPEREPFAIQVSDQCLIPYINMDLVRVYDEIIKKNVLNEKLTGHFIADARQTIRFNLDEKGATLKSEAKIYAPKNGHAPRKINFNRPFLLYMERKGAEQPYLVAWFENPELFVKHPDAGKAKEERKASPLEMKK